MPIPAKYLADFKAGGIYHVYNRTNNKEPLFFCDENRLFFLKRFAFHLNDFVDSFCWCLLTNHFHLLIRVKSEEEIQHYLLSKPKETVTITEQLYLDKKVDLSVLIEKTFKRFFQSYAQSFNKVYNRKGNLFYKPFKRLEIENVNQLIACVVYIHTNAVKHGMIKNPFDYKWSSLHSILSNAPTRLFKTEVIRWFGGQEKFIQAHNPGGKAYFHSDVSLED